MDIRFSIDSAQTRAGLLMGWGWFLSEHSGNQSIQLEIAFADGKQQAISCFINRARDDVVQAYPANPNATAAGFIFLSKLNTSAKILSAVLAVRLCNGESLQLPLQGFSERFSPDSMAPQLVLTRMQKAWRLIRLGRFSHVAKRLRSMLTQLLIRKLGRPANKLFSMMDSYELIFDHQLGGGANKYREEKTAEIIKSGKSVLVVTFDLPRLQYQISCHQAQRISIETADDLTLLQQCLARYRYSMIHVNNLVSYPDPIAMIAYIKNLTQESNSQLLVYLHDYLPVCPSYTLINADDEYCGVPKPDVCRACISKNNSIFPSFVMLQETQSWRDAWHELLLASTKIIAFSQSTVSIYQKAFPSLNGLDKVLIEPHIIDVASFPKIKPQLQMPLKIAVIGNINKAKGAQIIHDLLGLLAEQKLPVHVVVIGTLVAYAASPSLTVTGPFQHADLPRLLQKHQIGICWLPSICPETFSYVTEEIISMEMPLVCFDLGAPAARVRQYQYGEVAAAANASSALAAIMSLANRMSVARVE